MVGAESDRRDGRARAYSFRWKGEAGKRKIQSDDNDDEDDGYILKEREGRV